MSAAGPSQGEKAPSGGSAAALAVNVGAVLPRIEAVNDFVIKFANVNGSGSASANELFA